jgi:nucleoside phosphorylase
MPLLMEEINEAGEEIRQPLPKTPVLVTAATKWEYLPLAKALGLTETVPGRAEGVVAGRKILLLKTGIGAKNAADALGNGFVPSDFGLAISAGLCGAMQPEAKTGHVVADAREADLDLVKPLRETALALGISFHFGKILHTNIVLQPAAKKALGTEQRALACDMETASLRRWADGKTDAIAVRVVLDEINEILPSDMPEGEDLVSLARYALAHASTLPRLIGTGVRSARAMKTLSRFLKAYLETI